MKEKKKKVLALAVGIALLPPVWAVAAGYMGITTGAVALICAGLYTSSGQGKEGAFRIMMGFLCGDVWAVLALKTMGILPFHANVALFITLAFFGAAAVMISFPFEKWIFLPAWLCGWAIGLTIMDQELLYTKPTLPVQIAAAMIAGVWYVGVGVDHFCLCLTTQRKRKEKRKEEE